MTSTSDGEDDDGRKKLEKNGMNWGETGRLLNGDIS
jgi:hypothetical protein